TVTSILSQGAQVDTYSFSGNAGEAVRLTPSPSLCGAAFLVVGEHVGTTGAARGGMRCNDAKTVTLPTSGTYSVLVHDDDHIDTGSYSLRLALASPLFPYTTLFRSTVTSILSQGAQVDTYSFSGNAGEAVRLTPSPSLCGAAF